MPAWTAKTWAEEALRRSIGKLREAGPGARNDTLFQVACELGNYIADGALDAAYVESVLLAEAGQIGLTARESGGTMRSGLMRGDASKAWYPSTGPGPIPGQERKVTWGGRVLVLRTGRPALSNERLAEIPIPLADAPPSMRVTWYPALREVQGDASEWSWDELAEAVTAPMEWPGKKDAIPLWSLAEIEGDNRGLRPAGLDSERREKNREPETYRVHGLILDYDDEPTWSLERVREWWGAVRYVAHSSASHNVTKDEKPAHGRGRVILALSRPVTVQEYTRLAEWVLHAGKGVVGATELKATRRAYYVPARAPGGYCGEANPTGKAIDVDALIASIEGAEQEALERHGDRSHDTTPDGRPYLVKIPGGTVWFVATKDGYAAVDQGLVGVELNRHWPDVPTVSATPAGPKPMSAAALFARYGIRGSDLYYSYVGESKFVYRPPHTGDLHIQVVTGDRPKPVYHEDVVGWLRVLLGGRVEKGLDWLATAPRLDRPTSAWMLLGLKSLGKSMIALGLGRYFGVSIADYDDIFKGRFNDALLRSPVVWLDEGTETDARSAGFRKLTANSSHAIEAKNRPTGTLTGCPRLIVTANNPDPLKLSREDLTAADEDAIGERILMTKCSDEAAEYLIMRGGYELTHDWIQRKDGSPGKIPELIAWLAENRTVPDGGRFLVPGNAAEWAAQVGTREGLPATILDAIAAYMGMNAKLRENWTEPFPFLWDDNYPDDVLVSNSGLRARWKALIGEDERVPSNTAVSKALERLARNGRERATLANGTRPWVYVVPMSLLADRVDR